MKKNLLLIIFFFIYSKCCVSQILVDSNKTWNAVESFYPCCALTNVFNFSYDTVANSFHYKRLMINSFATDGYSLPLAAREDSVTRKVYFLYRAGEGLAYDFLLNIGDTFATTLNTCSFYMVVDSVDSVVLQNGETRRRLLFNSFSETWIEGIGSSNGLPYVGLDFCTIDLYEDLNCFSENGITKYINPTFPNCFYNTSGISEVSSENSFVVFPNPGSNIAFISFKTLLQPNLVLKVFDVTGQEQKEVTYSILNNSESVELNTESLSAGIYLVEIITEKEKVIGKFIKE